MPGLLSYYPSAGLTQAEKNMSRWQSHLARATGALAQGQVTVLALHPQVPGQSAAQLTAARRNYLRPLEERVEQQAKVVENGRQALASERALAYLAHSEREAAAHTDNWLTKAVGGLLVALIGLLPSRASQPALAFA